MIGRSVAGSKIWIVNPCNPNELLSTSQTGEILIEGILLADGYYLDPEKTKAAFIDNLSWASSPSSGTPRRFYATGDLAYADESGMLHYVGRKGIDFQKVNGVRMNIGEIEEHLDSFLPDEFQAAVEVLKINNADVLVAFVAVTASDHVQDSWFRKVVDSVRTSLAEVLTRSMIPSIFYRMKTMPLTSSGKIDRSALRLLDVRGQERCVHPTSKPVTLNDLDTRLPPEATLLRTVWAAVLDLPECSIMSTSDFFACGGNSLLAMKLVRFARHQNLGLTVQTVFKRPNFAAMSSALANDHSLTARSVLIQSNERAQLASIIIDQACKAVSINPGDVEDAYYSTPFQTSIMSLIDMPSNPYLQQVEILIPEDMNIRRLKRAIETVYEASAILRTRIVDSSGRSLQVVLRGESPFDDTKPGPISLSNQRYGLGQKLSNARFSKKNGSVVLYWDISHSLIDGWTFPRLLASICQAYDGQPLSPGLSFSRYARHLASQDLAEAQAFWNHHLADVFIEQFPHLPSKTMRPMTNAKASMSLPMTLGISTYTLPMIIRGAWAIIVAQWTGDSAVGFTITSNGRDIDFEGIEDIEGPTLTTIPVYTVVDHTKPVEALLRSINKQIIDAIPYGYIGLQGIQSVVSTFAIREWAQNTLVIQFEDKQHPSASWLSQHALNANYPQALMMECVIKNDEVLLRATYDDGVLSQQQVDRILYRFIQLLTVMVHDDLTSSTVAQVSKIGDRDCADLKRWNPGLHESNNCCIHDLVSKEADRRPNATAIYAWDGEMTYGELDAASSSLAIVLRSQLPSSSSQQAFIPLAIDKSKLAVVVMLAILKAGAACVPINADMPGEQLQTILNDISASIVVSSFDNALVLSRKGIESIVVSDDSLLDLPNTEEVRTWMVKPNDAAWVVFSSGTTGKPKGIVLEHHTLCIAARCDGGILGLSEDSRIFNFAAFSFDVCVADIFYTLIYGGVVCMPSDRSRIDDLAGSIEQLKANQVYLTATVAGTLSPSDVPGVRRIAVGGEAVPSYVLDMWAGECTLVNIWGPAEATPWASGRVVKDIGDDPRNIGHPLGVSLWLTNRDDPEQLLPIGAIGEILIDGPLLARGYLNRPKLTEKAFIPAPHWLRELRGPACPTRVYRTGDIATYNNDGSIRFIGRREHDIFAKIRGMRVELSEIEHHISKTIHGAEVAVQIVETHQGDQSLVAFISQLGISLILDASHLDSNDSSACIAWLSSQLRSDLPSYMVPQVFLVIENLPVSANGKLDRKRLQQHAADMGSNMLTNLPNENDFSSPKSDIERTLAGIWYSVLSIPSVSRHHNFIALGGDSVRAMKMVSLARHNGIRLSVQEVLTCDSLQHLALAVQKQATFAEPAANIEIPFELLSKAEDIAEISRNIQISITCGEEIVDIYPAVPFQENILASSLIQDGAYIMQNEYYIPEDVNLERLAQAWNKTIQDLPILRTVFVVHSLQTWQVVMKRGTLCETVSSDALASYLGQARSRVSALGTSFFLCAMILPSKNRPEASLVLTIHHALYDMVTLQEIWHRVYDRYNGASPLTQLPSYRSFVTHICRKDWTESQQYWCTLLQGHEPSPFPQHPLSNFKLQANQVIEHTITMKGFAGSRFTPASFLKAAWGLTVSQYSSNEDVVFGTIANGRSVPVTGIDQVPGPTINIIPVRLDLATCNNSGDLLALVQDQSSQSLPHEHLGIQGIARSRGDLRDICEFHNLFVVQMHTKETTGSLGLTCKRQHALDFVSQALTVEVTVDIESVAVRAQFDPTTITREQLSHVLRHFGHIIHRLVLFSPSVNLAELTRITPADLDEIIAWQKPALTPVQTPLHSLIFRSCKSTPDKVAIHAHDGEMTYTELLSAIQRTACTFQRHGVKPRAVIPVCARKGIWAPVTFLAILSCGAAFLPIEPSWPAERIRGILDQFNPSIIFVSPDCQALLGTQDLDGAPEIFELGADMVCQNTHVHMKISDTEVSPDDRAFVLMTSGSTGHPKGVNIQHQAIATHCIHAAPSLGCQHSTRLLQFSSYAYDAAFAETFDTLVHGGTLCLPSDFDRMNNFTEVVNKMQANMVCLTPAFLATMSPQAFPTLQTIVVAGDRVPQNVNDTWASKLRLIEAYGPAESCVATSFRNAIESPTCGNLRTPSWCALWVTAPDNPDILVPVGAVGELLIQGPVLASGYAGDEKKTAAAFIQPPRWMERSKTNWNKYRILYRTGDLVRQLTDGTYQFIGRHDDMRKHRGQRLELGEIEHHLRQCLRQDEDVVVELVEPKNSAPCIVGFLYPKQTTIQPALALEKLVSKLEGSALSDKRSKSFEVSLSRHLPSYMVPSLFLGLEQSPFSAAGKVDRKLLREAISSLDMTSLSPRNSEFLTTSHNGDSQKTYLLRQSWAEILGLSVTHVKTESVWHRIGGDSIRAMHLRELLKQKGFRISVQEILSAENLAAMAYTMASTTNDEIVTAPRLASSRFILVSSSVDLDQLLSTVQLECDVEAEAIENIFPATPLQVELIASTSKHSDVYISRQIWDLPSDVDITRFQWAWLSVSHSMPILRTRLVAYGSNTFQVVLHALPTWQWASNLKDYLDGDRKYNYGLGTELSRFAFVQDDRTGHKFVWTCHHSLYDGTSMELIMEQLLGYYANVSFPLLTPFVEYVKYLIDRDSEIDLEYWKTAMKGASKPSFPGHLDSASSVADGCIELHTNLSYGGSDVQISPSLCVQSALALVLARWANSDDIIFAITLNGRTTPIEGIENVIGPTMATVPLRCFIDTTDQAAKLVDQIQAKLIEIAPHQHVGTSGSRRISNEAWDLTTHLIIQPRKSQSTQSVTERFFGHISDDDVINMEAYPINIECVIGESSAIDITLRYNSQLLDGDSAMRFLHQLAEATKQISLDPTRSIADIDCLTVLDQTQIAEWNARSLIIEEDLIHERIDAVAISRAEEPAIYSWDGEATYGQLRALYRRLASKLISNGIGPESMVPLVFEKSINAIIAMLAVLSAGGCLVLLDASHPVDRLKMIVRNVNARIILCSASQRGKCEETGESVLVVDAVTLMESQDTFSTARSAVNVRPHNAAYVIHTSGSTGKPKAVVITHGQYCSGAYERVQSLRELPSPRNLQFASYAFDQTIEDILSGLMIGSCVCIPSESMRENVTDLVKFMTQARVNAAMWPATFAQLVDPDDVPTLKVLSVGGEPNTIELFHKWAARVKLNNGYGPAEASGEC